MSSQSLLGVILSLQLRVRRFCASPGGVKSIITAYPSEGTGIDLLRDVLEEALRAARDVLTDVVERGVVGEPMGRGFYGDLSYRGDLACEEAIIEVLRRRLGSVAIVSEELGVSYEGSDTPEYWALIDPVDGSANMARGIRFYSSGVAIARGPRVRDVVCTGVIDHGTGELFIREGEYSSHRNFHSPDRFPQDIKGRPTAFFHHVSFKRDDHIRETSVKIAERLRFFRVMGSALLEICNASVGRVDAYLCLTPELRTMDIVPALYFALGMGCRCASYPTPLLEERLDSKSRFSIIVSRNQSMFDEILSMVGASWGVINW